MLHPDHVADRVVLDGAQLVGADLAGRPPLTRLEQVLRAQQAADVVRPERRQVAECNRSYPFS
jgi:hypothetical protein